MKRIIRRAISRANAWLREDPPERTNFDNEVFAYPKLNAVLADMISTSESKLRADYAWGMLQGVHLAENLGIDRISVIEFGVAGGNGLVSMDRTAVQLEKRFPVKVDVYGFDTGQGLPKPEDYRDLPNLYTEGHYPMDPEGLKSRLSHSQLMLGLVKDTISDFVASGPAPVAFISFDLDLYSSTMHAFEVLEADQQCLMPRIHCYFDDMLYLTHSEFTGERRAISDFNDSHDSRKISQIYGMKHILPKKYVSKAWSELMYMAHIFDHDQYGHADGLIQQTTRNLAT